MQTYNDTLLQDIKSKVWFYEFTLPDGTKTKTDIPKEVLQIHETRLKKLLEVISRYIPNSKTLRSIDFASHEGFFSIELTKYFKSVIGIEMREESIANANLISILFSLKNLKFIKGDLTRLDANSLDKADFILCYGLLYHLENPIQLLRLASQLTTKHILIETQVFPFDISGNIEDGHFKWQRPVNGVFALSPDYGNRREGGNTEYAVIPSLNTILSLLKDFGFNFLKIIEFNDDDYEQFNRGSRVIIYGEK
jgi:tRNA (mo5U34)-methyltransferase